MPAVAERPLGLRRVPPGGSAGSQTVVTCDSVKVQPLEGAAEVLLGGGLTAVSVPRGATAEGVRDLRRRLDGENPARRNVRLTVDGVQTTLGPGATTPRAVWDFIGFSAPVDNPAALNGVNAGQASRSSGAWSRRGRSGDDLTMRV